jgi:hypothetical protein
MQPGRRFVSDERSVVDASGGMSTDVYGEGDTAEGAKCMRAVLMRTENVNLYNHIPV